MWAIGWAMVSQCFNLDGDSVFGQVYGHAHAHTRHCTVQSDSRAAPRIPQDHTHPVCDPSRDPAHASAPSLLYVGYHITRSSSTVQGLESPMM